MTRGSETREPRAPGASGVEPLIDVQDLVRVREKSGARFTLSVPRFIAPRGAFVAVVGESGCGKSTLLDMLGLVLAPTSGRFALQPRRGETVDIVGLWSEHKEGELADLRRATIGYVLQTGGLLPFLTLRENARLVGALNRSPDLSVRISDLAKRLGVADVLTSKPARVSGGQRQRGAILRALVHNPALILADEPTAAVDKTNARVIVDAFAELAREHDATIVMVTHQPDLVARYAHLTYTFTVQAPRPNDIRSTCRLQDRPA